MFRVHKLTAHPSHSHPLTFDCSGFAPLGLTTSQSHARGSPARRAHRSPQVSNELFFILHIKKVLYPKLLHFDKIRGCGGSRVRSSRRKLAES